MDSRMAREISKSKTLLAVLALGIAFLAGRTSSPKTTVTEVSVRPSPRHSGQSVARPRPVQNGPGAGEGAITSALQLRGIFKNSGGNFLAGKAMADVALARMNATELSGLVHDLATAQASTPGYAYTLEINTACARWAEVDPDAALNFALSNKQASFRSAAIGSIFTGIAKYDPVLARAKLSSIDDPSLRSSAQGIMLASLSVARPDDWIAAIKADPDLASLSGISSIATEWAVDDPAAAAARLKQLPAAMQRDGVAAIAKVWAGQDSRAAMAWAQSLTDPAQRKSALGAAAGGLAAQDPDAALAALDSLDPAARRAGLNSVFQTLADLDFDSALERVSALADPSEQKLVYAQMLGSSQYFGNLFSGGGSYASQTADQLNTIIAKLPPGQLRETGINQLGGRLAAYPRAEAEAILASYPPGDREKIQAGMLQNLSYTDPARALELYQSMPSNPDQSYVSQQILSGLARQDPEAALKAALAETAENIRTQCIGSVFRQLASDDPAAAARHLSSLPAGAVRDSASSSIAEEWGKTDPTAATAWARSLDGEAQTKALTALVPSMAQTHPEAAAKILENLLASSTEKDPYSTLGNATSNMIQNWSNEDPAAASNWLAQLPDGGLKNNAIQNLTGQWYRQDPEATATWLDTLPDGEARDAGVQSMIYYINRKDPASAFEWASSIGNDNQRASMLNQVVSTWKTSAPDKARAAIQKADVSDQVRENLLRILE